MTLEKLGGCGGVLNRTALSIPHTAKVQRTLRKKGQKGHKSQRMGRYAVNATSWIEHDGCHILELRKAAVSCIRSQQTEFQHRWGG